MKIDLTELENLARKAVKTEYPDIDVSAQALLAMIEVVKAAKETRDKHAFSCRCGLCKAVELELTMPTQDPVEPVEDRLLERVAQITAHRACCGSEHNVSIGKFHGCCVVCGVDWPCEYAGKPPLRSPASVEEKVEKEFRPDWQAGFDAGFREGIERAARFVDTHQFGLKGSHIHQLLPPDAGKKEGTR